MDVLGRPLLGTVHAGLSRHRRILHVSQVPQIAAPGGRQIDSGMAGILHRTNPSPVDGGTEGAAGGAGSSGSQVVSGCGPPEDRRKDRRNGPEGKGEDRKSVV